MRIWPVILDSHPPYLRARGRSTSLLLAPLGTSTVLEHLLAAVQPITGNPPLIVAAEQTERRYADWIAALSPTSCVARTADDFADALSSHELSDALLIIDPRCMPAAGFQFGDILHHHLAEPRVAHHLVAFEAAVAGTKERVCLDNEGQVRAIQRYYEHVTWPFMSGITATILPCASGLHAGGFLPRSLAELRHIMVSRGVPSRDLPIDGRALDLGQERGILAANEQLVLRAAAERVKTGDALDSQVHIGSGHTVHPTARVMGPVILHEGVSIEANATVLGPAVIGAGARIQAGAVVAHATVGPDCVVPLNLVIRERAWFATGREAAAVDGAPATFGDRLARVSMQGPGRRPKTEDQTADRTLNLRAKRVLDISAAVISLAVTLPLFALIAVAIWVESRGPVFYGDKREGVGGRVFRCWKFRTMFTGAHLAQRALKALDHTDGPHFKIDRDPRVTRVGAILRKLNLDEVPQLVNVLLGEMSLVGPRPSPFRENQVCVPWREARLSVRPGITGFWQVCRHNRSAGDFHQWIEYDLLYVQHLSFWLDVKILAATVMTLGGKAMHIPASWLIPARQPIAGSADIRPQHATETISLGWSTEVAAINNRADRGLVA
jgi:lipopolysaccharide/colanic/teichoic acid biosynthesis glycosyltransferase